MTLRVKISLVLAVIVLVAMKASGWFFIEYFQRSFRETVFHATDAIAISNARTVETYLDNSLKNAQVVAATFPIDALRRGDLARVEKHLETMSRHYPYFENGMFLLDAKGTLLVDYPPHPEARGTDLSSRQYFLKTVQSKKGIVGTPYHSIRTGQPVLTFTAYLHDANNRPLGVLGCSAQLLTSKALDDIRRQKLAKTGYCFAFDTSRQIILHPDPERILKRDVPLGVNRMFDAAVEGFEGVAETVNSRGIRMLAAFRRVGGSDWVVGCQVPVAEAFAAIGTARRTIFLFTFSVAALAAIIGWLLVRKLTYPLLQLESSVNNLDMHPMDSQTFAIDAGPAPLRELIRFEKHPEFGSLANTVKDLYVNLGKALSDTRRIADDLKSSNEDLERKNLELDEAYTRLKIVNKQAIESEKMASIGRPPQVSPMRSIRRWALSPAI